jgi:hypothetical protein
MTSGRQPDIGPNTSRSLEARRIIDRRLEAECGDRADTRQVMNLRTCTSRRASLWSAPRSTLVEKIQLILPIMVETAMASW